MLTYLGGGGGGGSYQIIKTCSMERGVQCTEVMVICIYIRQHVQCSEELDIADSSVIGFHTLKARVFLH